MIEKNVIYEESYNTDLCNGCKDFVKLQEENEELKAQIEKMKTFSNCKHWRETQGNCMLGNGYCICNKWEIAE